MKMHFAREQVWPPHVNSYTEGLNKGWFWLLLIRYESFKRLQCLLLEKRNDNSD